MAAARRVGQAGNAARDAAHSRFAKPLRSMSVPASAARDIATIIRDELNVKSLSSGAKRWKLEPTHRGAEAEGLARELVRMVNDLRRQLGFNVEIASTPATRPAIAGARHRKARWTTFKRETRPSTATWPERDSRATSAGGRRVRLDRPQASLTITAGRIGSLVSPCSCSSRTG